MYCDPDHLGLHLDSYTKCHTRGSFWFLGALPPSLSCGLDSLDWHTWCHIYSECMSKSSPIIKHHLINILKFMNFNFVLFHQIVCSGHWKRTVMPHSFVLPTFWLTLAFFIFFLYLLSKMLWNTHIYTHALSEFGPPMGPQRTRQAGLGST